jgi:hypothetical protein
LLFEHYRVGPALRDIDAVVAESKEWRRLNPDAPSRIDAWR